MWGGRLARLCLRPFRILFYARDSGIMHRLTARLLLLFALVGNFVPVALALSAASPPYACCVRKSSQVHPCHGMAMATTEPEQLAIRSTGCCNHDCCRGVTVARWAQTEPVAVSALAQDVTTTIKFLHLDSPITHHSELQSTRAPPKPSIG